MKLAIEPELSGHVGRRLDRLLLRHALQSRKELQVLQDRERLEQAGLLRSNAHQPLRPLRMPHRVDVEDGNATGRRAQLRGDLSQEGGFPGAIRPEDRHDVAPEHVEVDPAVRDGPVLVLLDESAHAHRRLGNGDTGGQWACRKSTADRIASNGLFR